MANRFARAASMSLRCGEVNVVSGLHCCSNHWFVYAYVYSRVGDAVEVSVPTANALLLFQLCTAMALLPFVVFVGSPVAASTSQATGEAGVPTTSSQPAPERKHQRTRVSVDE